MVFKPAFLTCYVKAISLDCPIKECVVVFSLVFRRRLQPCFRCRLTPVFVLVGVTICLRPLLAVFSPQLCHRLCLCRRLFLVDTVTSSDLASRFSLLLIAVVVFAFAGAETGQLVSDLSPRDRVSRSVQLLWLPESFLNARAKS
ncbi:hypothetical protein BDZ89DRAFT_305707 [Hymenopellis radicata]|nr:hypothetical protein BDZ89DRAFT_305707 [Hymenopellis radicata]